MDKEDSKELSRLINKIYNESELSDLIEFVLKQNNKIEVLEMIDLLVSFEKITATTLNATQQSSKVVESLKKALKQGRIEEEVKVNLKSSIETVIEVFQEDIQKRVLIEVKVDTNHCFNKANEYKIFQLWSNMITIILTNPQEKIQVHISSIQENGHLKIIFNVDSESDTDLFKDSVYDIIMNRQQNSIDLSRAVIKNIVQEYSGKIIVENKQGKSNFKITFPVK